MVKKKYPVFLICLAVFLLLFSIFLKTDSVIHSDPLKNLRGFPVNAIGFFPCEYTIPIQYIKIRPSSIPQYKRVRLRSDLPHVVFSGILFDKNSADIFIEIGWSSQTFFGGKEICRYKISDSAVKKKIINFIRSHEIELFSDEFERKIYTVYLNHYDELCKNPQKNPYVGLQDSGVFDWIREGKDPEVEWQKKYPSKNP